MTLIELLGVAIIVILLSLLALPVYGEVTDRTRQARSAEDLRTIEQALERHKADIGFYPASLQRLVVAGYLKPTAFKNPWSTNANFIFYFYAVDRSGENTALGFALGDPGPRSKCGTAIATSAKLYRAESMPLPCGRNPTVKSNPAWVFADGNSAKNNLTLVEAPPAPGTLTGYRANNDLKTES